MWDAQSDSIRGQSRNHLESECFLQAANTKNTAFFAPIIILK